ncbi:MAG: 50S ribosomal protein L21 [bacterium]
MYAIVETGGKQYKVTQGSIIDVEKIKAPIGQEVKLERVLMLSKDDDDVVVGNPTIDSVKVVAEVVDQARGKKITVMKFKRRKHYKRKMGHRQDYTQLLIKTIEM